MITDKQFDDIFEEAERRIDMYVKLNHPIPDIPRLIFESFFVVCKEEIFKNEKNNS